jgi:thioredoxin-dependent peroxiredoxin
MKKLLSRTQGLLTSLIKIFGKQVQNKLSNTLRRKQMLKVGEPLLPFTLPFTSPAETVGEFSTGQFSTEQLLGRRTLIFVYPQDDTYGWTIEATEFRARIPEFTELGVAVYGLSPDNVESHQQFITKHRLNFPLLADEGHTLIDCWGLWVEQEWNEKKYMGVSRTTLLIGADGRIERLWEKVKFQGHAQAVLTELE